MVYHSMNVLNVCVRVCVRLFVCFDWRVNCSGLMFCFRNVVPNILIIKEPAM